MLKMGMLFSLPWAWRWQCQRAHVERAHVEQPGHVSLGSLAIPNDKGSAKLVRKRSRLCGSTRPDFYSLRWNTAYDKCSYVAVSN